jgi:hypothetical protein
MGFVHDYLFLEHDYSYGVLLMGWPMHVYHGPPGHTYVWYDLASCFVQFRLHEDRHLWLGAPRDPFFIPMNITFQ